MNTLTGICALCPNSSNMVLACPALQRGHVRVEVCEKKIRKSF